MKIDKKFKGLIDEGWIYRIEGDIEALEELVIDLDLGLYITGCIKAGGDIRVGSSVEAGGDITAGGDIRVGLSIEAGGDITARGSIEALGGYITARGSIEARGGYIAADWYIKAGESYGIVAGLYVTCQSTLNFGRRLFAGTATYREISVKDKTVTCGKLESGTIAYGILKETGLIENDENETR